MPDQDVNSDLNSNEEDDRILKDSVRDAVLKQHGKELRAMKTKDIKFKNKEDGMLKLEKGFEEEESDTDSKKGTYTYGCTSKVAIVKEPEESKKPPTKLPEFDDPAKQGMLTGLVRSRDWRGEAPPEGEETSYIS